MRKKKKKKNVSPCNKPMRKRESVIEKIGWEQMWARMGVKAVSEPQAVAASRRTFSPPTLRVHGSLIGAASTVALLFPYLSLT